MPNASGNNDNVNQFLEHLNALSVLLPSVGNAISAEDHVALYRVIDNTRNQLTAVDPTLPEGILLKITQEGELCEYRVLPVTDDLISYLFTHSRRKSRNSLNRQLVAFNTRSCEIFPEKESFASCNLNLSAHRFGSNTGALITAKAIALSGYSRIVYSTDMGTRMVVDPTNREHYRIVRDVIEVDLVEAGLIPSAAERIELERLEKMARYA